MADNMEKIAIVFVKTATKHEIECLLRKIEKVEKFKSLSIELKNTIKNR